MAADVQLTSIEEMPIVFSIGMLDGNTPSFKFQRSPSFPIKTQLLSETTPDMFATIHAQHSKAQCHLTQLGIPYHPNDNANAGVYFSGVAVKSTSRTIIDGITDHPDRLNDGDSGSAVVLTIGMRRRCLLGHVLGRSTQGCIGRRGSYWVYVQTCDAVLTDDELSKRFFNSTPPRKANARLVMINDVDD
jgi:hypothetical protein